MNLTAHLAAGTITLNWSCLVEPCAECAHYPEVLDGLRKAPQARYIAKGRALCGSHARAEANGNEYGNWNANTGRYARINKTQRAAAAQKPGHIRIPKAPTPCSGIYARKLCSTHGGRRNPEEATCAVFDRKTAERATALAAKAAPHAQGAPNK